MAEVANYLILLILGISLRGSLGVLENALEREFRFHVSLRETFYGTHACGGAIITQSWILTTAGCANLVKNNPYVYAGSVYLQDPSSRAKTVQVQKVVVHESFNPSTYENNIALLQLVNPIDYTDNILNVRIPVANSGIPTTASICGWPPKDQSNPNANRILQVIRDLKLVRENCTTLTGTVPLRNGEFCGFDESQTSPKPCLSDIGSSLTRDQVLHGILSRTDCIIQPEILLQVSAYSDWIKTTLGNDANDIKWDNTYPGTGGGGGGASAMESPTFFVALLASLYILIRSLYL